MRLTLMFVVDVTEVRARRLGDADQLQRLGGDQRLSSKSVTVSAKLNVLRASCAFEPEPQQGRASLQDRACFALKASHEF